MTIDEILDELDLSWVVSEERGLDEGIAPNLITEASNNNEYIYDVMDSREFAKIYHILDTSSKVKESEERNLITTENTSVVYQGNGYTVTLVGDLDQDMYKMIVTIGASKPNDDINLESLDESWVIRWVKR